MRSFGVLLMISLCLTLNVNAQEVPDQLKIRYQQFEKTQQRILKRSIIAPEVGEEELLLVTKLTIAALKSSLGANIDLLADQTTSTNNFRGYWDFAYEPRKELVNDLSSRAYFTFHGLFISFAEAELYASNLIHFIEDSSSTVTFDGKDLSNAARAGLYLFKGVSKGYTGLLFDQGFEISSNQAYNMEVQVDELGLNFISADSLVKRAIRDIEQAITIVNLLPDEDFVWFFSEFGRKIDRETFKKMANSLIAKILINAPRSPDDQIDYAKILSYANAGLDEDFPNIILKNTADEEIADYYSDWSNFIVGGDLNSGSGFLPTDVKVMHLLDSNYPKTYPEEHAQNSQATFEAASSSDPRIAYFKYTTDASFLNSSRDPLLYSNYFSLRTYADNDWRVQTYPVILMTRAELQYIKAEAEFMLGNITNANTELQDSPYGTTSADFSIDLPAVQLGYMSENGLAFNGPNITSDQELFINILHKEYSVEISTLTTIGTHLFFMRRHGLLQELTPIVFPVPSEILKTHQLPIFNVGGIGNYENGRSAQRWNAWHLSNKYPSPSGLNANIMSEKAILMWDLFPSSYPDQPTEFNLSGNSITKTLEANTNSYEVTGLENNFRYDYNLSVTDGVKTSESLAVSLIPNIFSTEINLEFEGNPKTNEVAQIEKWLKNETGSPIIINSIEKVSFSADTTLYEDWLDFISIDIEDNTTINSGDSLLATVSLNSRFFGNYPPAQFKFSTNTDDFFLNTSTKFIAESSLSNGYPPWKAYHNIPDSIAFGSLEPGLEDSTYIQVENKSLYAGSLDTVYTIRNINNSDVPDEVFKISELNGSKWIKPGNKVTLKVKAEPVSGNPYEAFIRRNGSMFGTTTLGRLTVNNGERMLVSNENPIEIPEKIELFENYPNPFNPSTNIAFSIPKATNVTITVFNVLGQKVSTLVDEKMSSGSHLVTFRADNLSSGIYFYRLQTSGVVLTKKMMLIK